jgi:dethiobiotin synthetase
MAESDMLLVIGTSGGQQVTRKIFIAATGQQCGKTTTSVALMHVARKKYRRVGFIKPLGPKPAQFKGRWVDLDAALIASIYDLEDDLPFMSPVVLKSDSTRQFLDGKIDAGVLQEKILRAARELESRCDFLVIEGAGHSGVGSVLGLNNARMAKLLQAPMLMVSGPGIGNVIDNVHLNLALCKQEDADLRLLLINKLLPEKRDRTMHYLEKAFSDMPFRIAAGFDFSPILANPTLNHVAQLFNVPLKGDKKGRTRIAHHVHLGAASTQRVADLLEESTLLIVTSTRNELLVTLASLYNVPEYRSKIAGLVIPGLLPVSKVTQQIVDRSHIPYMRAPTFSSAEVFSAIVNEVAKINPEDKEKIGLLHSLAETDHYFDSIDAMF